MVHHSFHKVFFFFSLFWLSPISLVLLSLWYSLLLASSMMFQTLLICFSAPILIFIYKNYLYLCLMSLINYWTIFLCVFFFTEFPDNVYFEFFLQEITATYTFMVGFSCFILFSRSGHASLRFLCAYWHIVICVYWSVRFVLQSLQCGFVYAYPSRNFRQNLGLYSLSL